MVTSPIVVSRQDGAHIHPVESACPVTGTKIRLIITPERLAHLEPESAVVSIIVPDTTEDCLCDRGTFCHQGHFFRSQGVASTWQTSHQDAILLPGVEAYQLGR